MLLICSPCWGERAKKVIDLLGTQHWQFAAISSLRSILTEIDCFHCFVWNIIWMRPLSLGLSLWVLLFFFFSLFFLLESFQHFYSIHYSLTQYFAPIPRIAAITRIIALVWDNGIHWILFPLAICCWCCCEFVINE